MRIRVKQREVNHMHDLLDLLCWFAPLFLIQSKEELLMKLGINRFEINGDVATIFITTRHDGVVKALVSASEIERVMDIPTRWTTHLNRGDRYVMYNHKGEDGKTKHTFLHRLITSTPEGLVVDHINGDTLDNRNENLRVIKKEENAQNRKTHKNSKSGVRGVHWKERDKLYVARVRVNNKIVFEKCFVNLLDAEKAVKKARAEMMPYSQEAM